MNNEKNKTNNINDRELISVSDAAKKLGMIKQTLFKILKKEKIEKIKQRSSAHRGQIIAYIKKSDFDLIANNQLDINEKENFTNTIYSEIDEGVFYLIQLEPTHDPGRFKLGFASNLPERLRDHRCSAPYAKVLETWPCRVLWEKTAIDCATQNCEKIHTEVFRTNNIDQVKKKCESFFAIMPKIKNS